jgi:RNA polymerase-binding transcription factor DksA
MRHHFHRCMHLRVVSLPASALHGARRGGSVILEELCDARRLTPCVGLAECTILTARQKQELLVERATRIREEEGRPVALSGVPRARAAEIRQLRESLVAEREQIVQENLRAEAEAGGAQDRATLADEEELEAAGLSLGRDSALLEWRVERLDEIDRALEAMRDPVYGSCAVCGRDVESERLRLYPETRVCTSCAREAPAPPPLRAREGGRERGPLE